MKKSPNLNLQIIKMRPIVCNTELAFVFPEAEERKVNMSIIYKYFIERKKKPSDE